MNRMLQTLELEFWTEDAIDENTFLDFLDTTACHSLTTVIEYWHTSRNTEKHAFAVFLFQNNSRTSKNEFHIISPRQSMGT